MDHRDFVRWVVQQRKKPRTYRRPAPMPVVQVAFVCAKCAAPIGDPLYRCGSVCFDCWCAFFSRSTRGLQDEQAYWRHWFE